MDILGAMATFVKVVDTGSLSAAGRDLGLSQPAVSQKISALERHLNLRLLHRTTRRLALTEAGATYHRKAQAILDAVREAEEAAAGRMAALTGPLRVHAPAGFGQTYLADAAIGFQRRHPGVAVELIVEDRFADLRAEGVDVAIRFGTLAPSGLVARRLGTLRRILVASPAYVAAHGNPESPETLRDHVQVMFNGLPDGHVMPLIGPDGPVMVPVRPVFTANNAFVLTRAIGAGLGLGGAQLPLIRRELETGALIRVMTGFEYAPLDIHAVYPAGRFIPSKVKAFVAFLDHALGPVWAEGGPDGAPPRA